MLNGNLFCSSSPGLQSGHMAFNTSCLINNGSQLSQSPRHVTPSASSHLKHPKPWSVQRTSTPSQNFKCKGSQNLLSYHCFIFSRDCFLILMIWHNSWRRKPQRGSLHHDHTKNSSTCLSYLTEMLGSFRQY